MTRENLTGRTDKAELRERKYPEKPLVGVGVVVLKDNKILLVKRGAEPNQGLWAIPGGLVELGEPIKQTAIREVREECGITIEVEDVVSVVDLIHKDDKGGVKFHYVLIDFWATYKEGELLPGSDVLDAQWFSQEQLAGLDLPELTRKVINKVCKTDDRSP